MDTVFGQELRSLAERFDWLTLIQVVAEGAPFPGDARGLFSADQLAALVPDFAVRTTLLCGPPPLMTRVNEAYESAGLARPAQEQFQVQLAHAAGEGQVVFTRSGREAAGDSAGSLLELAEQQGLNPPSGCRMGICHACKCHVSEGRVRDLRNGEVRDLRDEDIQLCVHTAAGAVHVEL